MYDIYKWHILTIMEIMKQWPHSLEGENPTILIQCNHKNFEYFQTVKVISHRQGRWAESVSSYDFVIKLKEENRNLFNEPS
jgi:hypothetical protein